jgi:regulatory protein
MSDETLKQVKQQALNFLARREHASLELRRKLLSKGFDVQLIDQVLTQLQESKILSDERFLESFVRSRINKGQGPLRIQQELQQRGLAGEPIVEKLDMLSVEWVERAQQVRQKRFGQSLPHNTRDKVKQMRFLQYRGFTNTQIKATLTAQMEEM